MTVRMWHADVVLPSSSDEDCVAAVNFDLSDVESLADVPLVVDDDDDAAESLSPDGGLVALPLDACASPSADTPAKRRRKTVFEKARGKLGALPSSRSGVQMIARAIDGAEALAGAWDTTRLVQGDHVSGVRPKADSQEIQWNPGYIGYIGKSRKHENRKSPKITKHFKIQYNIINNTI